MDLIMIGGLLAAVAVVVAGVMTSGDIMNFYSLPSIFIVLGGTVFMGIASFPAQQTLRAIKAVAIAFRKTDFDVTKEIELIIFIANVARREGLLALEDVLEQTSDPFVKKGINLIIDGTDPELTKRILETELEYMNERHTNAQAVFEQLAAYSPAFGMLGTLIGLINMLLKLGDVSTLGPLMSVALVTTFYGLILSNMVFTPIARKLKYISAKEYQRKELLLEGLLAVQDGVNPRIIRDKLESFVSREEVATKVAAGAGTGVSVGAGTGSAAETREIG